jgi:hypothetical protein
MLLVPPSHVQHVFLENLLKMIHFKIIAHHITFCFLKVLHYMFRQYGHHQVFKIIVKETAALLLSWVWLLISKYVVPSIFMRIQTDGLFFLLCYAMCPFKKLEFFTKLLTTILGETCEEKFLKR